MHGIKESKEAAVFFGSLVNTTAQITQDGRVSLFELVDLVKLYPTLTPALDGIKAVPAELGDLDDNEINELKQTFANTLKLPRAAVEYIFEDSFELSLQVVQFIDKIRDLKKQNAA